MMKSNQLWFHLNQNIAWRSTCQQNLLNGGSKCGDMQDKCISCVISNKVMQDLMMVLVEMFSNSHHSFLPEKLQSVHWKLLNITATLTPAVEKGKYYLGTIGMNRVHDWHMIEKKKQKKQGKELLDYRDDQNNKIIIHLCDNKAVFFWWHHPLRPGKTQAQKTKTVVMVPRPSIVITYSRIRGGFDFIDMPNYKEEWTLLKTF